LAADPHHRRAPTASRSIAPAASTSASTPPRHRGAPRPCWPTCTSAFGDWRLAITAYSRGTTAVDKLVADAGTRDGRVLQQRGLLGRYLTNVNVGVLLLRDPALLD
jgi:hypothetical protein